MADEQVQENQAIPESERVGFCQDCGRPLSATTVRAVGSGVFCEPCLERRVAAGPGSMPGAGTTAGYGVTPQGWQATGGAYPPPPPVPHPPFAPVYSSSPSPLLAGLLGFIPGVGAMYNGQFAKGVVHLIVFAVLVSLSDHVSGVFGLFVAGWVFFMAFEAFHTAKARRDGLPLPDPFGWNDIGERLGFGKNWPGSVTTGTPQTPPVNPAWQQTAPQPTQPGTDWVGYVPPTNFASTPNAVVPPAGTVPVTDSFAEATAVPASAAPFQTHVPPPPPGSAVPYADVKSGIVPPAVPVPTHKFPVGAMWLIGLGVLFLLGNINRDLHMSWRWTLPVIIAGFATYLLVTRLREKEAADTLGRPYKNKILIFRGPVMLYTVAVLMGLQSFDILTLGQTWPVLLVVLGALLLLERTFVRNSYGPAPVMDSDVTASPSSWNAAKGGQ